MRAKWRGVSFERTATGGRGDLRNQESEADRSSAYIARGFTGTERTAAFPFTSSDVRPTFASTFPRRVPKWHVLRLAGLGFPTTAAFQLRALNIILPGANENTRGLGQDAVVLAQTGSGKTLAYLLMALKTVDPTRACVQVAIVVPI
jgi:superfamily II DNA/RNA helicase